jgi:hypothetical protein
MVFIPPEIVVFEHVGFGGFQRGFNVDIPNLDWHFITFSEERFTWNDRISSVIVISGTWQFFTEPDYQGQSSTQVRPGGYTDVEKLEFGIANDKISSFKVISYDPQGDGFRWV